MNAKRQFWLLGLTLALSSVLLVALACSSSATATPAAPAKPVATPVPTQASASATSASGAVRYGGAIKYVPYNVDLKNLDASKMNSVGDSDVDPQLYDHLVFLGTDFSLQPGLAKSWDISQSGSDITFHLQQGVKFHDGTPFNAQAVKFHFDRTLDPNKLATYQTAYSAQLNSVEVIDQSTVVFHMKQAFRPFMGLLGAMVQGGGIVSPTAVQKYGDADFNSKGIATGPFMVKEWLTNQRLTLVKNKDYWRTGVPYVDQVDFIYVPDGSTRLAMLRSGEADIVNRVDPTNLPVIQTNADLQVIKYASPRFYALQVDLAAKPWDNLQVRQALAYSLDRNTLIQVLLKGEGVPAYSPEGTQFWWSNSQLKMFDYNPDKAKQLLSQAGFPNGVSADMWASADELGIREAETYQSMLKKTGFNLNIITVPPSDNWQMVVEGKIHFVTTSWRPRPDPDGRLRILYTCKGSQNYERYCNTTVDKLIDQAAATYDTTKAKALYDQIQNTIVEEVGGHAFTYFANEFTGARKGVQNYKPYPDGNPRFMEVWLSK